MIEGLGLTLRPWRAGDAGDLVTVGGDEAMRRWTGLRVGDPQAAVRWLEQQRQGWDDGTRFSFAVVAGGVLLGNALLKRGARPPELGEVGFWTTPAARGSGVASRAVRVLTGWAWTTHPGLRRLELFHRSDNVASCRVAVKTGFAYERSLPPRPPDPHDGHQHALARGTR